MNSFEDIIALLPVQEGSLWYNCETNCRVLICLLGTFCVLRAGHLTQLVCGSKTEKLLCLLALHHRHGLRRETVLEALWPNVDSIHACQSLHSLIHSVNKLLGDENGEVQAVVQANGVYWLNSAAGINVDVTCFEALVDTGNQRARTGDTTDAIAFYNRALALYRGDLCMATDAQVVVEREHLRGRYLSMLAHLARLDYARDDYTSCLNHTMRLLTYDPCREDAYRLVMRCYVRMGERAQALRQYRLCETILHTEFGAVPEPATTALFDCIRLNPANMETALLPQ